MTDMTKAGGPMPANLGRCVDLYHDIRALRLSMEKEVKEVQQREAEIREHLIQNLHKSDDGGAVGMRYMARRVTKTTYRIGSEQPDDFGQVTSGWGIFTSWVRKNNAFHFIQKRLNETSVADFIAKEGRLPPGVDKIDVPEISVTKVG